MFDLIKWLPKLLMLKDVAEAYHDEKKQGKPFWISKRFIGAVLLLLAGTVGTWMGLTCTADQVGTASDMIEMVAVGTTGLYSMVLMLKGQYDAGKRKK